MTAIIAMKDNINNEKKSNVLKWLIILLLVVLIGIGVCILVFSNSEKEDGNKEVANEGPSIGYEDSAVLVTDENELQNAVDAMIEKTKDGMMSLEYQNIASSTDGEHFKCYLANSIKNPYDMYIGIYLDQEYKDELLLTGLIRPGSGMKEFKTTRKLEKGSYNAVLVFTRVKDDHTTIKDQVSVTYTLTVN